MLVAPILDGNVLHGVCRSSTTRATRPLALSRSKGSRSCARRWPLRSASACRKPNEAPPSARRPSSMVWWHRRRDLRRPSWSSVTEDARTENKSVEHMLMANFKIRPAQIGPSLAKFFGVPYEPFNAGRIRSEALHGPLKREFIEEQGWIPLEESPEGLVIMCVDPEAVRGARVVPQVFPRISKFAYRVTTMSSSRRRWASYSAPVSKAARSTSCWPTWTVARSTTAQR
jgi:hypothetical protein